MEKIKKFKEYVENIIIQNFDNYSVIESLDDFSYIDYDNAIDRINCCPDITEGDPWEDIFIEEEMLKIGVMYACIVTGAISSDLTTKLISNWERLMFEHNERTKSFFDHK